MCMCTSGIAWGVVGNAWCVQASYRHYVIQRHLTSLHYFRPIVAHSLLFIVQFTYLLFIFTVNNTTSKCMYIFTYRTCYESASFKRNATAPAWLGVCTVSVSKRLRRQFIFAINVIKKKECHSIILCQDVTLSTDILSFWHSVNLDSQFHKF